MPNILYGIVLFFSTFFDKKYFFVFFSLMDGRAKGAGVWTIKKRDWTAVLMHIVEISWKRLYNGYISILYCKVHFLLSTILYCKVYEELKTCR